MEFELRVGCQGWRYPDWRKQAPVQASLAAPFYPFGLAPQAELYSYSRCFDLVEVDATFYGTPTAKTVEQWREETPPDFRFTLKLPRALTHEARLRRGKQTLFEFCRRAEILGDKLAAILIQLTPSFSPAELPSLERFLPHLPTTLPFAIEFRDAQWLTTATLKLLEQYQVALTLGATPWLSTAQSFLWLDQRPTDWLYLRFMGIKEGGLDTFTHLQVDRTPELTQWATRLQTLACHRYVLMDNHYQGFSPGTAMLMRQHLGLTTPPFPRDQGPQQLSLL